MPRLSIARVTGMKLAHALC